ncbi:hypothetical protein CAPTEDRAFT_167427 [Capitella teleta]|uniref:Glycogen debranching enzyme n=1 Tax=Capitella teleta TaxID=283909 RepID=R7UWR3_CAPTE|nr:hypothetical protein CAPTEDRAFT_167427 [Capitella teleta]|eukprot:ELU10759.1 hypothetical protein CAPTEDRAFT_167427 [Capitella teleta]
MASFTQLRLLTLNEGEKLDSSLFRLEKGWHLHFVLGPSLAGKDIRLFTNHPSDPKAGPNRSLFRELSWGTLSGSEGDSYDTFAEVYLSTAGSFNYFFTLDGSDQQSHQDGSGYFVVDPVLRFGQFDEKLPLDCICCQTVLAKSLGPLPTWESRLQVAKESGYNMVHFTPIQSLGASNSSYSLRDQLELNPIFSPTTGPAASMEDVKKLVEKMKTEWNMLSLTDLVFNHTANESPWIQEHPECVYNVVNSPHLKPAYLLDRILWHFSEDVSHGKWGDRGVPAHLCEDHHLDSIRSILTHEVLPKHRIEEYYLLSVDGVLQAFRSAIMAGQPGIAKEKNVAVIPDPLYRRLKATIDIPLAINKYFDSQLSDLPVEQRLDNACNGLRPHLEALNHTLWCEVQDHLNAAVNNFIANGRYRFIDPDGPRIGNVNHETEDPIMYNYFLLPVKKMSLEEEEAAMHTAQGAYCMAHNGWVMNDDPLRNFAEPGSNVYLRRELIPWGDSVKLRFGNGPEDCPYLWEHMKKYTCQTAEIFHGVRLDNCHSTPIHVAEYMLDEARKVRPDLYVMAELFTSSEVKDNIFINRLGLNSLIREGLAAWDSHELGRLVHRYGGHPVGAFIQPPARPLVASLAHALFMDQTHDNPSPVEKRTSLDLLPSAALVSMACCATGSNRGYDELVPHHIHVVSEGRLYQSWTEAPKPSAGQVNINTGIISAKRALNGLHQYLGHSGFNQVFVDQVDSDTVSVTRHNPVSHQSVILVARTVFSTPANMNAPYSQTLQIPGMIDEIILEGTLKPRSNASKFTRNADYLNGLTDVVLSLREHLKVEESDLVELKMNNTSGLQELEFACFPPGSVIAFKVSLNANNKSSILNVRQTLSHFGYRMSSISGRNLQEIQGASKLADILVDMTLNDLNRVLHRCDAEEKDDGKGFGAYDIPGFGTLPYCGLQGIMSILSSIRANNDLGHPMCDNLRRGDWLMEYTANRLAAFPGTERLGNWLADVFKSLKQAPRYLIPCYFDALISGIFCLVEEVAWAKLSPFVRNGSSFTRALSLGSLQFCSHVRTALLPVLSPHLRPPVPPLAFKEQACVSMAAGLPHFASGIFRNWGRDTFIALRGLLLLTGREAEARFLILAYGATLRHGLIPNLLGGGSHARYNCRDAVWWWLQCIKDYCICVPGGAKILTDKISRIFPTDESEPQETGNCEQELHEIIQEALQRHADGVEYVERNAGPAIDNDMTVEGFHNKFGVNWETGFVFGGNASNCGTWMDKMGGSSEAGNKGKPATPRDGSAVELVGLCKSVVSWLQVMHGEGLYPHEGVLVGKEMVTWQVWADKIQASFERHFWINFEAVPELEPKPELINRRGIYKDSFLASQIWADYQLRPNFTIAMVVAPELFTPQNAWIALERTRDILLGPLGMKTLDPSDWAYNGNYINSDHTKGFNYHQGPEWVWPVGFFLRAMLHFGNAVEADRPGTLQNTMAFVKSVLSAHNVHLRSSPWRSLPELTNKDGAVCGDSCPAQAWSMGCILEVIHDLETLMQGTPPSVIVEADE